MSETVRNTYVPDVVSPPGETLEEILEMRGMSQAELAERTGRPKKTINEIVQGKAAITAETAIQLERVLGVEAGFWNNREAQYREFLARRRETDSLAKMTTWLQDFPYAAMARLHWVPETRSPIEKCANLLSFFAVATPDSWQDVWSRECASFHRSNVFASKLGATTAWLRRGEIEARSVECPDYDSTSFRNVLRELRGRTRELEGDFRKELVRRLATAGVVIVFVPEVPGTHAWGVTRWLSNTRPMMQLSLRYRHDDHFWFTVFHEAAHILLHGKREIFVESDASEDDPKEQEANEFARNWLIPPAQYESFLRRPARSSMAIRRFAHDLGIAPGIVVGRLQHDRKLRRDEGNDLKKRLDWFDSKHEE
jgi:HTH-type transcriptional regulator / antitoxin HigA